MHITRRQVLVSAAATAVSRPVLAQSSSTLRETTKPLDRWVWDVDREYPTAEAWVKEAVAVRQAITTLLALPASHNPESVVSRFRAARAIRARGGRLARYAVLKSLEDESSQSARKRVDAATALETEIESALAPIDESVVAFSAAQTSLPGLTRSERQSVERLQARIDRTMAGEARRILRKAARWPQTCGDIYDALTGSDLGWRTITAPDGTAIVADAAAYRRYRRAPEPAVRRAVMDAHLERLTELQDTFGLLLARRLEGELLTARERRFATALDYSLQMNDGIPAGTVRPFLVGAQPDAEVIKRWLEVIQRESGETSIRLTDVGARTSNFPRPITIGRSMQMVADALAPLGLSYVRRLQARWGQHWWHLPPRPNKAADVGVYWQVGGGHPYAIMSYRDDLPSSATFASVSALAMWYADLPEWVQSERREDDFPVFSNAVWFAARMLHHDALLKRASSRAERNAIIVDELWFLQRGLTYLACAALQQQVEIAVAAGTPMSGSDIGEIWRAQLNAYYPGIQVPASMQSSWITEPQGFNGNSLAVFAVAMSLAAALAERVSAGDRKAASAMTLTEVDAGRTSQDFIDQSGLSLQRGSVQQSLARRMSKRVAEYLAG